MATDDKNKDQRPGVFGNLVATTPVLAGTAWGGYSLWKTLSSNKVDLTSIPNAIRDLASMNPRSSAFVGGAERAGISALKASISHSAQVAQSMVNNPLAKSTVRNFFAASQVSNYTQGQRLKLATNAFLSTVADPRSGFSKSALEANFRVAQQMAGILKDPSKLTPKHVDAAIQTMQGVLRSKSVGTEERGVKSLERLSGKLNKNRLDSFMFPSATDSSSFTQSMQEIGTPQIAGELRESILAGRTLPGKARLIANGGYRIGQHEFAKFTFGFEDRQGNLRSPIDFFLPASPDTISQGLFPTSKGTVYQLPRRVGGLTGVETLTKSFQSLLDRVIGNPSISGRELRAAYAVDQQELRGISRYTKLHETAAEKYGRYKHSQTVFPAEVLSFTSPTGKIERGQKYKLFNIFKDLPNAEPVSGGALMRGAVIAGDDGKGLLQRWFFGTEHVDWSTRPYQALREDINFIPTLGSRYALGVDQSAGIDDLSKLTGGPRGAFRRFMPVNPGSNFDELTKMGILVPHQLQLHVTGDMQAAVLEKYGLGKDMGEAMMKKKWKNILTFEETTKVDILHGSANQTLLDQFEKAKLEGTPLRVPKGTPLGITQQGKVEISPGGNLEILDITSENEGQLRFHTRKISKAREGLKIQQGIFGGPKSTVKFREASQINQIVSEVIFGKEFKSLSKQEQVFTRSIDLVTSTAPSTKDQYKLMQQMTGAFKAIVAGRHRTKANIPSNIEQFLQTDNPMKFLADRQTMSGLEGFIAAMGKLSDEFGISLAAPHEASAIFGGAVSVGDLNKEVSAGLAAGFGQERAKAIEEAARKGGFALSWAGVSMADTPLRGKAQGAVLELRTIENLMKSGFKFGDEKLGDLVLGGLMQDAYLDQPGIISSIRTLESAFKASIGKVNKDALGVVPEVDLSDIIRGKYTETKYFQEGTGVMVRLPEHLREAAASAGMKDFFYMPGRQVILDEASSKSEMRNAGFYRDASGELVEQDFGKNMNMHLRELKDVMLNNDKEAQTQVIKRLQGSFGNYLRIASQEALKVKLGASAHVQLAGVANIKELMDSGEWTRNPLARQEVESIIGKGLAEKIGTGQAITENLTFLGKSEAARIAGQVDWSQMGMSQEEFLKGQKGLTGAIWRHPTVMDTSLQMSQIWAAQGKDAGANQAYVQRKLRNVKINENGKIITEQFDVSMLPGMKADMDKDMISMKVFQDAGTVSTLNSNQAAWMSYQKDLEKRAIERQIVGRALSTRIKELGTTRAAELLTGFEEKFGKEQGAVQYKKAMEAFKVATGKDIGPISKLLEEVAYGASMAHGDSGRLFDQDLHNQLNTIFSELEETGTLKARKAKGLPDAADRLVQAMWGFDGTKKGSANEFFSVLQDIVRPALQNVSYAYDNVDYKLNDVDQVFGYMMKNYNEYSESGGLSSFRALHTQRPMSVHDTFDWWNSTMTGNADLSPSSAFLRGIVGGGSESQSALSQINIGGMNAQTMVDGAEALYNKTTRKIPGPMLIGLLGTSLALGLSGNPGYGDTPLTPDGQGTDGRIADAIRTGSLLMQGQQQPDVPIDAMGGNMYSGGGPAVSGKISTPIAPLSSMGTSVRIDMPVMDMSSIDVFGLNSRLRGFGSNTQLMGSIQDYRRPIIPNDRFRDG